MLVAPFNDIETVTAMLRSHQDEIGGVIVEPCQRLLPPAPGFLEGLRRITTELGIPLIFDEVVTGFRYAYGGGQNITVSFQTSVRSARFAAAASRWRPSPDGPSSWRNSTARRWARTAS